MDSKRCFDLADERLDRKPVGDIARCDEGGFSARGQSRPWSVRVSRGPDPRAPTREPIAANVVAMPRPMPLPAPVTKPPFSDSLPRQIPPVRSSNREAPIAPVIRHAGLRGIDEIDCTGQTDSWRQIRSDRAHGLLRTRQAASRQSIWNTKKSRGDHAIAAAFVGRTDCTAIHAGWRLCVPDQDLSRPLHRSACVPGTHGCKQLLQVRRVIGTA